MDKGTLSSKERDFQKEAQKKLQEGHSVLIIAPTGLGKTRAALCPFFGSPKNGLLNTRLIYTLPIRALTRGVDDECKALNIKPVIHHGDEPESVFFSEKAIITTIDQYLTAFAGAPLSWASHLSHAAAGAVLTSYSVFDEAHLLSPQKGLQLLFAILYLRRRWGLLSCVMTATLPEKAIERFQEFCGLEVVTATANDIQQRDSWRNVYLEVNSSGFQWDEKDEREFAEFVIEKWNKWQEQEVDGPQKIIVFVNTVERALKVYRRLKDLVGNSGPEILLAHSRFTKEHRKEIEDKLQRFFGKEAQPDPAILVTTQVAEAGLNISAPLVITDLCPMDSLIQRAGRCQRFRRDGERVGKVLVVKPKGEKWYVPYTEFVRLVRSVDEKGKEKRGNPSRSIPAIEFTQVVLEQLKQKVGTKKLPMNWGTEQEWLKQALDRLYEAYLSGTTDVEFKKGEQPFEELYKRYGGKKEEVPEAEEEMEG